MKFELDLTNCEYKSRLVDSLNGVVPCFDNDFGKQLWVDENEIPENSDYFKIKKDKSTEEQMMNECGFDLRDLPEGAILKVTSI